MNENLIEEENTVYEIDPDCRIVSRKEERKGKRAQSTCLSISGKGKRRENKKKKNNPIKWAAILLICLRNCN
ncbi:MAG: hypothetical protein MR380_04220 [Lachnospiraceae bacterium]|nr:hypothetical protein [Lachnospiraceae bacterium]